MARKAREQGQLAAWIGTVVLVAVFVFVVLDMSLWQAALTFLFPGNDQILYPRATVPVLMEEHLSLVATSSVLALIVGIPAGVFVTRRSGRDFLQVANDLTSLGQTIPPVAVLALAVPLLGFGFKPTVFALFLYSILPIVRNTISGLEGVPVEVIEAARGMGMTPMQVLLKA
ncbi:MAG TPA: ABC transporter permease, partial [Spirochaetia bacterium]|nr:ABC transporter permease [Spirochaetia bacterium]